ncbi:MAG: hypothetical protein JXA21_10805 [Anaerolineae bacterium]|nr:hypothetical protein [Anaerolineae bacterium]
MNHESVPEIGPEQLDAILHFLPIFEQSGYAFGEWYEAEGQFPHFVMNTDVSDFIHTLYEQEIAISFDWSNWKEAASRYVSEPGALEKADLLTVRKLLTAHVRADRFIEGHLAGVLENGHIIAVLRRLKTIREQMSLLQIQTMKYNERELPCLDSGLLDTIFKGVYGKDCDAIEDVSLKDFLVTLYTMQRYNYQYRPKACAALFPIFEETVGPMEINSEGTTLWLALGLAIKELYGMRTTTLRALLAQVTIRK